MADTTNSAGNGSDDGPDPSDGFYKDSGPKSGDFPIGSGTIDSVDGRPILPFSVAALVISFIVLYFTPILDLALGLGNTAATVDPTMKLLVSFFLAFGIGIFWEYIF